MSTRLQPYLLLALSWAFCLTSLPAWAQDHNVYAGDLTFFTQAELDTFSYKRVTGDLTIGTFSDTLGTGTSLITDLSALQKLTRVDGALVIGFNNNLPTLKGLENLCHVGGTLLIYNNDQLTSLEGLNRLQNVGGDLTIEINDRLQSLKGLEKLTSVQGNIYLDTNEALPNLSGLNSLRQVGGLLVSSDNDALVNLEGLGKLETVGGLSLGGNAKISSLSGLNPLVTILGQATFRDNPQLAECCIVLTNVQGQTTLARNASGCSSLAEVEQACLDEPGEVDCAGGVTLTTQAQVDAFDCTTVGSLTINAIESSNDPITNLKALCSLVKVERNLTIGGGSQLTSLDGLHQLKTIGGSLNLTAIGLTNFEGLKNLSTIGSLTISDAGLESFLGLNALESIRGDFRLTTTYELTNFRGLEKLRRIEGTIDLIDTRIASYEGLSKLESVGGFDYSESFEVDNFTGLTSLKAITGVIVLDGEESSIDSFKGLEAVTSIGTIRMRSSYVTNFEGLGNLNAIETINAEISRLGRNCDLSVLKDLKKMAE